MEEGRDLHASFQLCRLHRTIWVPGEVGVLVSAMVLVTSGGGRVRNSSPSTSAHLSGTHFLI